MEKSKRLLMLIAIASAITISAVALALNGNFFTFTKDFTDIIGIDRRIQAPSLFNLSKLPEFFSASVVVEGSGYTGQPHTVDINISHSRPDSSIWLASGDYSLDLEITEGVSEEQITSGSFTDLRNTFPYIAPPYDWTPSSLEGSYGMVLSLNGIQWTSGFIIVATAGTGGTISPSGQVVVLEGTYQEFNITADPSYKISDIRVDGETLDGFEPGTQKYVEFADISSNHNITAVFTPIATFSSEDGRLEGNQSRWSTWDAAYVNSTFEGLLEYSYLPGDNVSFTYTIQKVGEKGGWTMDYYWDIERVGGGDRHKVIPESNSGSLNFNGGFLTLSDSFPVPDAGEWVLILYIEDII